MSYEFEHCRVGAAGDSRASASLCPVPHLDGDQRDLLVFGLSNFLAFNIFKQFNSISSINKRYSI